MTTNDSATSIEDAPTNLTTTFFPADDGAADTNGRGGPTANVRRCHWAP